MTFFSPLFRFLSWITSVLFQTFKSFLILNGLLPPPPFPLFRVPCLPLGRIIDFMDPDALVSLSFCSRKSHSVIKTQRKAPFNGRLGVSGLNRSVLFYSVGNLTHVFRACSYSYFSNFERSCHVKMNGLFGPVQVNRSNGNFVSYWDNTMDGLKAIIEYVTDLFNLDVVIFKLSKESLHLIEWMNSRQKTPLKKVVYVGWRNRSSEEELIYILRDCTTLSEISIHSEAPINFQFLEKFRKIDCLEIWHGQWVTIGNLLTMDGIVISLEKSTLTNIDFIIFLRHWLSGGWPRLKLFCAKTGYINIFRVLAGLLHNAVYVENSRDYTSPYGHQWTLSNGYDIKRADGVTATVHYQPPGVLVMAVWPEASDHYN
ncbi:hypothetical protein CRE_17600 [Caenorhabditis remanei]|uniref:Uncharacterized protein n=1 Tax=Caenorhabditis remanei TaxID=31234 RepID=E3NF64_CAERE|nr:hypothetical protein CRE_17600 [Caenorhabditis remanei]